MIAQLTLVPLGTKSDSLSSVLSKAMKLVVESGLDYRVGPMGTSIEGEWYEIMSLVNRCRKAILRETPRVMILLSIDDRKGSTERITGKVNSLERKVRKRLKR